jgi:hypothetical protein
MPTIKFFGRVLPSHIHISGYGPQVTWAWQEENLNLVFRPKIQNSATEIECDVDPYKESYISELFKRASDLAKIAVNMAAFTTGYGLAVVLETMVDPMGERVLHRQEQIPQSSYTSFGVDGVDPMERYKLFAIFMAEPSAFIALDDLIKAITSTHTALADCGRVVDRIRRMIAPDQPDRVAWRNMQTALNVSRAYLEWIGQQSTGSRHGDPTYIPGKISSEAIARTWIVMNRFLEYRKKGNQTLTAPDFALLV